METIINALFNLCIYVHITTTYSVVFIISYT